MRVKSTIIYYSLVVREDGAWGIQHGDYDRESVLDEMDEYEDRGYSPTDLQILCTSDEQEDIDAMVRLLNGLPGERPRAPT